jgi:hypothetical protein
VPTAMHQEAEVHETAVRSLSAGPVGGDVV